jgi:polar amino acid transport system substrate-binding protein
VWRARIGLAASVWVLVAGLLASPVEGASLAAIREKGRLQVCAHPDALPFSSQDHTQPGIQLEIAAAIATLLGVQLHVDWIVLTRHARRVDCDAIIGSIVRIGPGEKPEPRGPKQTKPYAGSGYLLIVPQARSDVHRPEDLKGAKVGVEHTSWPHYLLNNRGIATSSYLTQTEIIEAVAQGEVAAGMVTDPYVGWYLKGHPGSAVKVADGYVRDRELQWNVAVGLRNADDALVSTVNEALDRLLAAGTVQGIFARYGVTYTPPHPR